MEENKDRDHCSTMDEKDPLHSFFQYKPFQNNNVSVIQNPNPRDAPNLCPSIPRNLHRSEYSRINNNTPTLEEVKSAICSSDNINNNRNITNEVELYIIRMKATVEATLQMTYNFGDYITPLALMAKDRNECQYLLEKIYEGKQKEVDNILFQVKPHLHELMMHPCANFLIQLIFQEGIAIDHMDTIVFLIILDEQKLKNVCMNIHGTRVIQKMLEKIQHPLVISPVLYTMVVYTMSRIAVELMKDIHGGYVILQCMKLLSLINQKVILDELATNCIEIATNQIGSSVIQKCLSHAKEGVKIGLVKEIISNAIVLAEHPFGNHVLKYLIRLDMPSVNKAVMGNLQGTYVRLSMNENASNVVENLLQLSRHNDVAIIVEEIMESNNFLNVLQDPFGYYVAQRALACTKGSLYRELSDKIKANHKNLQNHLYGKKVLAKADAKQNRFH